jgi:hypothetical protein
VIAAPRLFAGAEKLTVTVCESITVPMPIVGASGGPAANGVTEFEADDAAPDPAPFVAAIVNV